MTLKILGSDDVTIRPFKVHKSQVLTYISGSDVSGSVSGTGAFAEMNVALAQRFPLATTFISGTVGHYIRIRNNFVGSGFRNSNIFNSICFRVE